MKVVTAIDSFKGSMTSMEAGFAAAEGIHRVDADAEVQVRPLADGGEGTVEALVAGMNGKTEHVKVTGPLGEPVICEYGIDVYKRQINTCRNMNLKCLRCTGASVRTGQRDPFICTKSCLIKGNVDAGLHIRAFLRKILLMESAEAVATVKATSAKSTVTVSYTHLRQWADVLAKSGTPLFVSAKPGVLNPEEFEELHQIMLRASEQEEHCVPLDWEEIDCPEVWGENGETITYDWFDNEGPTMDATVEYYNAKVVVP